MKRENLKKGGGYLLLCAVMILAAFLLIGCGSDGDTGATGATGPPGPPGAAAPGGDLTTTAETCSICHGQGKIADIAVAHPDPTGEEVTLSNIVLTNTAGIAVVSFNAATADGPVTDLVLDDFKFMIADLVPAGTDTLGGWGTWDSPYFERWAYESPPSRYGTYPQGTLTNLTNGDYSYVFATGFAEATVEAPDYDPTHTQRLVITVSGHEDASGNALTNNTVGFLDFVVPAVGASAVALDSQRQFVTADACKKCHSQEFVEAAHADRYLDTRTCVVCHSPLGHYGDEMQTDDAYLPVLIHQIHAAIDNPAFEDQINGMGFGAVTFPQEIRDCVICHSNPNNLPLGTGDKIDNWKNHPTAEICGSCHIDVDFTTGANHEGGVQLNSACTICHQASGPSTTVIAPIPAAHDITPRVTGTNGTRDDGYLPANIREFDVTLSITPPSNGIFYDVGEAPEVTVTLVDRSNDQPVAPALYTTPQDSAGNVGGGLSEAYVQVSGPRAKALPVLATDTFTDPNWAGDPADIEDEHGLFVLGTDPQIKTDSLGFRYQLLPIPDDLDPGTYLVRVVFADYGRVGSGDYRIDSTAWTTVQIRQAEVEPKVSGDACVNCHGSGTAPFHDERHSVPFDTDQCLACHHDSGNGERVHGVPLANRVHAVHSSNAKGDIYFFSDPGSNTLGTGRDWTDITYPRDISTCTTCHNSQYDPADNTFKGTYKTLPYMMPCAGCHVGEAANPDILYVPGVADHMVQNGGPWAITNSPD
jgi:hypothetical protein